MSASTITRATWTDDDGTGLTGTVINNARLQGDVYDKIDAMFSGTGSYTTLSCGGDITVTGKATVNGDGFGVLAVGGTFYNHVMLAIGFGGNPLIVSHQVGAFSAVQGNSAVKTSGGFVAGFETQIGVAAGAGTLPDLVSFSQGSTLLGSGATITRVIGFKTLDDVNGTNNAVFAPDGVAFTGNWYIYYNGTRASYLAGNLTVGAEVGRDVANNYLRLDGGIGGGIGANVICFGNTHATVPGQLQLNPIGTGDILWGKALVALGGGAAPTLGTIGGAGPAAAAQNKWLQLVDTGGAKCWIPVWK